ncbi:uncharacterized protein DS421_15g493700 [Arachis hypogaea]|nr:uncharacterized protein DS421_15g493700 [Arachis hypogaea]
MVQQRAQQSVSGSSGGSLGGLADGSTRVQGPGGTALSSDVQVHQSSQSAGGSGIGSHDGGNSHGQEAERSTSAESSMHNGNDQPLQQGFVASAASAFDAAKDIMEALRSKHANLASELEVPVDTVNLNMLPILENPNTSKVANREREELEQRRRRRSQSIHTTARELSTSDGASYDGASQRRRVRR